MIRRVIEVIDGVNNCEDIGEITTMYDCHAEETTDLAAAVQAVVRYQDRGFMNVDTSYVEIFTVH